MPFLNGIISEVFAPEDLDLLQAAYDLSCAKLDRCPTTHEDKNELARMVIRIYEGGERHPEKIAELVYRVESLRD